MTWLGISRWWLGICVAGCAAQSWAASSADYCSGPIRIALFEFGALYRSTTNDGVDVGLIEALEKRTGCTFERLTRPRARIWKELEAGTLDMATAAISSPERRSYLYFSPYMRARNVVLVRRTTPPVKLSQATLESGTLRMGVVRGFRHEPSYDELVARMKARDRVTEVADVAELLRILERKQVDVVLSQPIVYSQYVAPETFELDYDVYDWAPPDQASVGSLVFSRKRFTPEQARHWDALVVSMLRDGTLAKIMRQYMAAAQARELIYTGPRQLDEPSTAQPKTP